MAEVKIFGTEKYGNVSVGIELRAEAWHTVLALEKKSVLLEVKAGPFDPKQAKELAPWAPSENGIDVAAYYDMLSALCREKMRNIWFIG